MSKKKSNLNFLFFFVSVLLPTLIAGTYYFKYASDQYVSESRFTIQSNNQKGDASFGFLSGLTGMASSPKDSMTARDYILSQDILKSLPKEINIRERYSNSNIDWWARLPADASEEALLRRWDELVWITYDNTSGISTLEVTAFTPKSAVEINQAILDQSEIFVNNLSRKARADAVELAAKELELARQELMEVREKIYSFNSDEGVVNPQQRATAEEGIVSELKQKLSVAETEYTRLSSFMQSSSMKVRAIKAQITSLRTQITRQQKKWEKTNPATGKSVTTLIQDTSQFTTELTLAEKIYESAIIGLRQAKRETKQQQRYLEVIVTPQLPDEALKPEKLKETITIFLASLMIWGIFSLLIASVRDHLGWV